MKSLQSPLRRSVWGCTLLLVAVSSVQGGSISDSLMEKFTSGETKHDAILQLPSVMSTVLSDPVLQISHGAAKTNTMTTLMKQLTSAAQAPFMQTIESLGMEAKPFYVSNDISLKEASFPDLQVLATIPGTFTIREPVKVKINPAVKSTNITLALSRDAGKSYGEWGVNKIGAPEVWEYVTKGEGVIVANIDTGVNGDHDALTDNYAGQWYDPVDGTTRPFDDDGHGTHTMGTICGNYGIGVAPGARWIACRGLGPTGGTESDVKSCGQWILEQRPHVVSNSWGGEQGRSFFNDVVSAWTHTGILSVFAIGNSGPACGTALSPGDQPGVWSVGSTNKYDEVSQFSSRGPSVSTRNVKPDVVAPGENIVSAHHSGNDKYASDSGTSMAAPHVAGAAALILSAYPHLSIDEVKSKLEDSAVECKISETCNSKTQYPNNVYGYGRISVSRALLV